MKDLIRSGRHLVAAGYCMYGSYCEMILVSVNYEYAESFTWTPRAKVSVPSPFAHSLSEMESMASHLTPPSESSS
jgi:fructose-1,6-bisphosphatase